ncbi:MAG: LytR C-terminal domain-containing protein [Acidimicrobiales bacterium]
MTFEPPHADRGGSSGGPGGHRAPSGIAPVRALVVLVIFVVAAVALVDVGTRPPVSGEAATTSTTSTTVAHKAPPTTTTTTVPRSAVSVVVANATETNGLAEHYSVILGAQGWAMKTPVDASTTVATSAVYYAAGQQESAASIATTLGIKPAEVLPLTAAVPVAGATGTDVVVVIGSDLAAQAAG